MRLYALLLCTAFSGQVCAGFVDKHPVRPSHWATPVKKDANLYQVDEKFYRSEQLTAEDVPAVHELGIKSVINLRYFDRNDNEAILADSGILLLNKPLLTWRIRPGQIAEILYLIEQQQQQGPVLVHCYHGADRTGLISAMYRIVYHGWDIAEAKREMQQGSFGYHSIWKNIDRLLNEQTITEVKAELSRLKQQSLHE